MPFPEVSLDKDVVELGSNQKEVQREYIPGFDTCFVILFFLVFENTTEAAAEVNQAADNRSVYSPSIYSER